MSRARRDVVKTTAGAPRWAIIKLIAARLSLFHGLDRGWMRLLIDPPNVLEPRRIRCPCKGSTFELTYLRINKVGQKSLTGRKDYWVGQCSRCELVYWIR